MCKKAGYSSFFVLIYLEYSSKHRANASKPCQRSVCGFFPRVCEQIAESDRMTPCRGWGSALRTNRTQVRHVFPLLSVPCRRVSCTTPQKCCQLTVGVHLPCGITVVLLDMGSCQFKHCLHRVAHIIEIAHHIAAL